MKKIQRLLVAVVVLFCGGVFFVWVWVHTFFPLLDAQDIGSLQLRDRSGIILAEK